MPLNKADGDLYQELLAEQKSRQAHAAKLMMAATAVRGAISDDLYKEGLRLLGLKPPPALPEPEFSLEELESAQKIIDDLA